MELLQIQNVKKVYTTKLGLTQCVALQSVEKPGYASGIRRVWVM